VIDVIGTRSIDRRKEPGDQSGAAITTALNIQVRID